MEILAVKDLHLKCQCGEVLLILVDMIGRPCPGVYTCQKCKEYTRVNVIEMDEDDNELPDT